MRESTIVLALSTDAVISVVGIVIMVAIAFVTLVIQERSSARRATAADREARVASVTDAYIAAAKKYLDSGLHGALAAGVLSLRDSTEVLDFCARVRQRLPPEDWVLQKFEGRIRDEQLLEFFERLDDIDDWTFHEDRIDALVADLARQPVPAPAVERPEKTRAVRVAAFLVVLGLAGTLRIADLCKFPLDNDEIAEVSWARQPWKEMLRLVERDKVHPPLDYVVQYALTRLSASECSRRIPSVVAGLGTIAVLMMMAYRLFGSIAAIGSGFLLSVSPLHIRFSQEVRPYSLGFLALSTAIWALVEYRRTRSRSWAALWFGSMVVAAYALYFAALVGVLVSAFVILSERKEAMRLLWRRLPLLLLLGLALYAPWCSVLLAAARQEPLAPRDVLSRDWFTYRVQVLATGDWQREAISLGSIAVWLLVVVGIVVASRRRGARFLVVWLVAGFAVEIAILQMHPHPSAVRHILPAWLALFPLAGAALAALTRRRGGQIVAVTLLAMIAVADARTLRAYYDHGRPDWLTVAHVVAAGVHPNERVFVGNGWTELNFGYYWRQVGGSQAIERLPPNVEVSLTGPAWIVVGSCSMDTLTRETLDRQPLRFSLTYTNHAEVRYLPIGATIKLPRSVCLNL